jgi:hypothetical protein
MADNLDIRRQRQTKSDFKANYVFKCFQAAILRPSSFSQTSPSKYISRVKYPATPVGKKSIPPKSLSLNEYPFVYAGLPG